MILVMSYTRSPLTTPPSGWTELDSARESNYNNNQLEGTYVNRVYRRRASSEPASYTVVTFDAVQSYLTMVSVRSGVDESPQVAVGTPNWSGSPGTASDYATITFPSVTTDAANAWIGVFGFSWQLFGTNTVPSGTTPTLTERVDSASALYFAEGTWSSSGATGARTTASNNGNNQEPWIGYTIAIENASSGSSIAPLASRYFSMMRSA
jgi:hypothetical protein